MAKFPIIKTNKSSYYRPENVIPLYRAVNGGRKPNADLFSMKRLGFWVIISQPLGIIRKMSFKLNSQPILIALIFFYKGHCPLVKWLQGIRESVMEGLFSVGSTKKMTYGDTKDLGQLHGLGNFGVRSSLFNPDILAHPNTKLRGKLLFGSGRLFFGKFLYFPRRTSANNNNFHGLLQEK